MQRFLPTDAWVRWTFVPMMVFMALVSDHGYLADFWHHLARGRAMAQTGALVDKDQFTFTVFGESFQDVNWLSQLIYFGVFQLGGLALVQVVNASFLAGTLVLLIGVCRRRSGSLFWASLVGAAVFVGIWQVLTIRPQTFSLFLFVLLLDILERSERRPRLLFLPPILLALWTNLHGAFPAGLILMGCFFLAAVIQYALTMYEAPRASRLGVSLLASAAATLVNPYGWGIYLYVGETSQRAIGRHIDEWMPPSLDQWIGKAFFISLVVLAGLLLLAWRNSRANGRKPLNVCDGLLLASFLFLAGTSVRMVAWWLLIIAPLAAKWLAELMPQEQTTQEAEPTLGAGLTFGLLTLLTILSLPGLQHLQPVLMLRMQPRVEADLDAVHAQLRSRLPGGRVFSRFEWGEYLTWSYSPDFAVFMDGRIEIFPDDVWNQYADVTRGVGDWERILDAYHVDALLLDSDYHARTGLLPQVERSSHWHKQFTARKATLYLRTTVR
jgi:hypothetical protein